MLLTQINSKKFYVMAFVLSIATAMFGFMAYTASAHQDPGSCTETGVGLSLAVFRSDGTTTISGGQTVTAGELVKYRATLSHLNGANCNYEGGTLTITTPDGTVNTVASPATPVPFCISIEISSLLAGFGLAVSCGSSVGKVSSTNGVGVGNSSSLPV